VHTLPHLSLSSTKMWTPKVSDMLPNRAAYCLVLSLVLIGNRVAASDPAENSSDRMALLQAQIAAGEFVSAIETAQSAVDAAERSSMLSLISDAQIQTGDFGAALGTIRRIPQPESRTAQHRKRARQQSLAGGTGADFQTLIELIQSETDAQWEEVDGIGGTISEFETGVRVDPHGLLAHLGTREQTGRLRALGLHTRQADLHEDMARPSQLRMVSITRLERAVADRLVAGQPVVESMHHLAGLTEVQYLFVYPETGDIVLAGPAEGWKYNERGDAVGSGSGRPMLNLDDLVTVLRTFSPEGMNIFGCSINPRQQGMKDLKEFAEASQSRGPLSPGSVRIWARQLGEKLGRQDIEIYGVPVDSRAARVIVEADYRMKLIGIEKLDSQAGIPSYFDLVGQTPELAGGSLDALRWWLTMKYEQVLHSEDHNHFEIRGSSVLCQSENQFLTSTGERVQTGKSEPLNQLFAANFTQQYQELAAHDPIFADMQNLFDLAMVAALIRHERLDERIDWDRGIFAAEGLYQTASHLVPLECESVVNHRVYNGKDIVVQVAGGVRGDFLAVASDEQLRSPSPRLGHVAGEAQAPELPAGRWWWDAR
jgi:hypothetical protein